MTSEGMMDEIKAVLEKHGFDFTGHNQSQRSSLLTIKARPKLRPKQKLEPIQPDDPWLKKKGIQLRVYDPRDPDFLDFDDYPS